MNKQEKKRIILRSSIMGYCMGVKQAVDSAIKAREDYPISNIYTLGQLIHNPNTLKKLESLGISTIEEKDLETILKPQDVVIIRAHGTSPEVLSILNKKSIIVIDSTCPHVISNRTLAQKCAKNGLVILAGDKKHPELKGIASYILNDKPSSCIIIENAHEAKTVELPSVNIPSFLIAQTTIKEEEFDLIKDVLESRLKNLKVFNTICSATFKRQNALKKLLEKVDAVIVIGGKNSANTKRLFTTCEENGKPACFIENIQEIPKEFYEFSKIGIASGASTPQEVIDKIEKELNDSDF